MPIDKKRTTNSSTDFFEKLFLQKNENNTVYITKSGKKLFEVRIPEMRPIIPSTGFICQKAARLKNERIRFAAIPRVSIEVIGFCRVMVRIII